MPEAVLFVAGRAVGNVHKMRGGETPQARSQGDGLVVRMRKHKHGAGRVAMERIAIERIAFGCCGFPKQLFLR